MGNIRVNDLSDLINQQIDYQEDLSDCLSKAEALVRVALNSNFLYCSEEIKHNFLWALCDIIDNSKMINEQTLNLLFECNASKTEFN